MSVYTTRRHLPYPVASDTADVPRDIGALATALDYIAQDQQGTFASRPAASSVLPGTYYLSTDTGVLSRANGTGLTASSWDDINPKDAVAGTASLRTLGTTATTAAAGNDARLFPTAVVTTLPASPTTGQICVFQTAAMATAKVRWTLQYNGTKWEFVGGAPLFAEVITSETTTSTTYASLATVGPQIAVPVAGDYVVDFAAVYGSNSTSAGNMSYDIGATAAVDTDSAANAAVLGIGTQNNFYYCLGRSRVKTLTAVTLTCKYKVNANIGTFFNRNIKITPVVLG